MADYDYCVIGGGIVGLCDRESGAGSRAGRKIIVLEKESGLAVTRRDIIAASFMQASITSRVH